ncbi:MAG: hypothetical protein G3M78_03645 [Candidatus Nitrohelix vancouverensis]|uniref:Uncharacterized protein n=1 Tax=Candidatus Nitrohelix vancouverensis TaxID=2705534 RepID=A0A7T0C111_9BACT|nr:MAG: hypothetical protein G3M78_03645 [Candidatus Nitrohelix vancouverensis]
MSYTGRALSLILFSWFCIFPSLASAQDNSDFNELIQVKRQLETQHGVKSLECYPFLHDIGFDKDQAVLISRCLTGARTLLMVLPQVEQPAYHTLGVGFQYLKTGGFQTAILPWNASAEEMVNYLNDRLSLDERNAYLDRVSQVKRGIIQRTLVPDMFCKQSISNENCLKGYESLLLATQLTELKRLKWRSIAITPPGEKLQDAYALALAYDLTPAEMRKLIQEDLHDNWTDRRRTYEAIDEHFGESLQRGLGVANFFCRPEISESDCLMAASNLAKAGENETLRSQFWGQVQVEEYNTLLRGDFDVTLRYDLKPEQIISAFEHRLTRAQTHKNNTLAQKLEGFTKNNTARLRAVCDLEGLSSALCVNGMENFIRFVKTHRDFQADPRWNEIMFVDGKQLYRVNFALNSSMRQTYIYIDATSGYEEFERALLKFGKTAQQMGG